MRWLVKLSINYPKKTLIVIGLLTVFFAFTLIDRFAIEINPSKSFSRDLDVIQFYNLTLKKFGMKDIILIGIENDKGVYNKDTLRYIDDLSNRIGNMKIPKTFESIITGKEENVMVPSEIDYEGMMSIIDADDAMVDKTTNTVFVGNLTSRARKKAGLIELDEFSMKKIPADDADLERMIPYLQRELRNSNIFRGTLVSEDEKACGIMVPIERNLDVKNQAMRKELYVMINADELKSRFMGKDYYFPHEIFGKTIDGIAIDDGFVEDTAQKNRKNLKEFALELFEDVRADFPDFYRSLKDQEVNAAYIDSILSFIESDKLYETESNLDSYNDMIDELYVFVIENIDVFSRDNLEYKMYNVRDGKDVGLLYDLLLAMVAENKPEEIKTHIAGMPVAQALIERFVVGDMTMFLNVTVLVIIIILFLSFQSVRGVVLPLACVGIGTTWVMALLLLSGFKISSGTITLPTMLIAVGSAYIIHYISRYYEIVHEKKTDNVDTKEAILETTDKVQIAINLSAITTISAFMSIISSAGVIDIKMIGILTSIGIVAITMLTYSFIPAIIVQLKVPKQRKDSRFERGLDNLILRGGQFTFDHSKTVFFMVLLVTLIAGSGIYFLKTESSITYFFRDDNPLRSSSKFIDKKLTGTGQMAIVFKMRDRVNLTSTESQQELYKRIDSYARAYQDLLKTYPSLQKATAVHTFFKDDILEMKKDLVKNGPAMEERIKIMTDVLNEYYEVEVEESKETGNKSSDDDGGLDLASMSDDSAFASDEQGNGKEAGIKDILKRMGIDDSLKGAARQFIVDIRQYKTTPTGKEFIRYFNTMGDFFEVDVKQPIMLRKLDMLSNDLQNLTEPKAIIDKEPVKPVGKVVSLTDSIKLIYKVFYHDDNEKYNKLPDVSTDNLADRSLTDKDVIGVCVNQFSGSSPEQFKNMATTDLKYLQFMVLTRSDKAEFLRKFDRSFKKLASRYFPKDDPYIEKIVVSGLPAINMTMNVMLFKQQTQSIMITIGVVFLVCFSIFRSFMGGLLSIAPISLTVIINLGLMGWFDFPISYGTVIIASIAIGAGIDYTIHFVERFKFEFIEKGDDFKTAYFNTLHSTGRAIVISAASVAAGFAVLMLSTFKMLSTSGLMIAMAMLLSAAASLTVLPALFNWMKPSFLEKRSGLVSVNNRYKN